MDMPVEEIICLPVERRPYSGGQEPIVEECSLIQMASEIKKTQSKGKKQKYLKTSPS